MIVSSTTRLLAAIVVKLPVTVKLPLTLKLLVIEILPLITFEEIQFIPFEVNRLPLDPA